MASKYSIVRQGNRWYVREGWSIVFYADTKAECVEWCANNP